MPRAPSGLIRLRDRYDAILLDLDGTIMDASGQLALRTERAIGLLKQVGFRVMLCTGRSPAGTIDAHIQLGLDGEFVAYNGSWIGPAGGPALQRIDLTPEQVDALAPLERTAAFAFRHDEERKWTLRSDHGEHDSVSTWYRAVHVAPSAEHLPRHGLLRVTCFLEGCAEAGSIDPEATAWRDMDEVLRAALRREVYPLSFFPGYESSRLHLFEVQRASRGKAEALDWLARRHGISADRTIAVGDQNNDLPMLAGAGLAVAMGNGFDSVKDIAHVVLGHHANDAFACWIEAGAPHAAVPRGWAAQQDRLARS